MNNHFAAKSVANAVMVQHLAGEGPRGEYPDTFTERYPAVAPLVERARPGVRQPSR